MEGTTVDYRRDEPTGWVGWIWFAAVMMMIGGALQAIHGLVAVVNDDWVVWGNRGNLYLDLSEWGWIHLIVGIIVFLSGLGVLSGNVLARFVGVVLASLSLVANFLYLPAFPLWAIVVIAIDVLVIYALTVHGGEARAA
jgi:hypothetical protein